MKGPSEAAWSWLFFILFVIAGAWMVMCGWLVIGGVLGYLK